jgi:hypothetical protein
VSKVDKMRFKPVSMEFGIKWNCTSILYRVSTDDRISDAYLGQEHILDRQTYGNQIDCH